jgi:hypothetical protein
MKQIVKERQYIQWIKVTILNYIDPNQMHYKVKLKWEK